MQKKCVYYYCAKMDAYTVHILFYYIYALIGEMFVIVIEIF